MDWFNCVCALVFDDSPYLTNQPLETVPWKIIFITRRCIYKHTFDDSVGCHSPKLNRVSMKVINQHTCTDQLSLQLHVFAANDLCRKGHCLTSIV